MAKVSDVLKLSVMRGVRVVAGEEGLFRKVEHVTVMEVPEIKRWLKGNDFLITSFYSVRKSEEDQRALIRDLADTCCCIAVKTGQYVKTVAESVKRAADEVGLVLDFRHGGLRPDNDIPHALAGDAVVFRDFGQGQVLVIVEVVELLLAVRQQIAVKIIEHGHAVCLIFDHRSTSTRCCVKF